ncbi:methyltransferase domain-containing protein [Stappia sp. F7233]|uniref:Methyltransferase domain-containing protein n=1 Tax=Stappia albiluteola TaxID=2758565 RepID=A0A839AHY8_9HYPH|nr:methyltransferase domain-containing protein [Stappia albiluteola]MBA5778532.1 methyltransferase domain-containing protein [Stappia albiluteola]
MKVCRICDADLPRLIYHADAPALTSISSQIDVATDLYACEVCGHVQGPDLPDVQSFYDTDYRISLQSDDFDQLYEVRDGLPVYRTDEQARLILENLKLSYGASVLDYGAAKAATLSKILLLRPDIDAYVYDVSSDYKSHWDKWLAPDHQALYSVPGGWRGKFDLVTAHFVLEHLVDPVSILKEMAGLIKPDGRIFFTVPSFQGNPGDLLVVDHLNHFTEASLAEAVRRSGLSLTGLDAESFRGAYLVTASQRADTVEKANFDPSIGCASAKEIADSWTEAASRIESAAKMHSGKKMAIYGAGFYGSFIAQRLKHVAPRPAYFIDSNQHLQGSSIFGIPVISPSDVPADIAVIFVGLNPIHARRIISCNQALAKGRFEFAYIFDALDR